MLEVCFRACLASRLRTNYLSFRTLAPKMALVQRLVEALVYALVEGLVQAAKSPYAIASSKRRRNSHISCGVRT